MDSSVHGISQWRILEWTAIPFSSRFSWPKDWTLIFCIGRAIFYHWATGETPRGLYSLYLFKDLGWYRLQYQQVLPWFFKQKEVAEANNAQTFKTSTWKWLMTFELNISLAKANWMTMCNSKSTIDVVQSLSHVQLWNSTDHSTPSFPILQYLPELAHTCIHWVDDAIQPSRPPSPPSPPKSYLQHHNSKVSIFWCSTFQWKSFEEY